MVNNNFLCTKLLIIQAAMAGVQDSALVITVSIWGGGVLPSAMISPEILKAELSKLLEVKHKIIVSIEMTAIY